jgi:Na+/H+-dicarboxylate symporter
MPPALQVLVAFAGGLALGTTVAPDALLPTLDVVGRLWIHAIRMPVIPLIVVLIISGVAGARDTRTAGTITARAVLVFALLLVGFAAVVTPFGPLLQRLLALDPADTAALRAAAEPVDAALTANLGLREWAIGLIPVNPFAAAAEGALLPLVVVALAYGLALTRLPESVRAPQLALARGIGDALLVVVLWALAAAPIGVFALAFVLGARVGVAAVLSVGTYILALVAIILACTAILYLVVTVSTGTRLRDFAAACWPAQVIAFGSRSSLAALPALIAGVRSQLAPPSAVSGVVLPLAASIFKLSALITCPIGVALAAALYGVPLDGAQWVLVGAGAVLVSLITPGIPSGSFLVQAPLWTAIGLPLEGLGVLIAVDLIPDVFKTGLNITGYAAATAIVARWSPADD